MSFDYPPDFWPWSGWITVAFSVQYSTENLNFDGEISGHVMFDFVGKNWTESVAWPFLVHVINEPHKKSVWVTVGYCRIQF